MNLSSNGVLRITCMPPGERLYDIDVMYTYGLNSHISIVVVVSKKKNE